jgi:hypothetical protein
VVPYDIVCEVKLRPVEQAEANAIVAGGLEQIEQGMPSIIRAATK